MNHVIAMGGGGFSMEPDNPLLDQYILQQSAKKQPKICFVPTASGDAEGYIQRFYDSFENHLCNPSHLSLFKPPTKDLEDFVLDKDIIYVGGGNTVNLMVLWRQWGLDNILRKAWENGVIMSGLSAGSLCWFEEGITDSWPGELQRISCLGLLEGSHSPHYDGEEMRRPSYQRMIESGKLKPGYAADDGVALHFIGSELQAVVSSRLEAKGYYVSNGNEQVLKTTYLGTST